LPVTVARVIVTGLSKVKKN